MIKKHHFFIILFILIFGFQWVSFFEVLRPSLFCTLCWFKLYILITNHYFVIDLSMTIMMTNTKNHLNQLKMPLKNLNQSIITILQRQVMNWYQSLMIHILCFVEKNCKTKVVIFAISTALSTDFWVWKPLENWFNSWSQI